MQPPAKYLVLIDAADARIARLFDASHRQVVEFDASSEEVAVMTRGLTPARGAAGTEWGTALQGHSAAERAGAEVYTLDV